MCGEMGAFKSRLSLVPTFCICFLCWVVWNRIYWVGGWCAPIYYLLSLGRNYFELWVCLWGCLIMGGRGHNLIWKFDYRSKNGWIFVKKLCFFIWKIQKLEHGDTITMSIHEIKLLEVCRMYIYDITKFNDVFS